MTPPFSISSKVRAVCAALCATLLGSQLLHAEETPRQREILSVMERVADWQLANPSKHRAADWTCATGWAGVMALAEISHSPRFHDAMLRMGWENNWDLLPTTNPSRIYDADDHVVAQTYLELYLRHREPAMLGKVRERFDYILAHPSDAGLQFDRSKNGKERERWSWCDSLFMGPPTWVRLFAATGERAYLDFMVKEWIATSERLYDEEEHLFYRDDTYFGKKEANGKKIFWGRGNGWVLAGLARVLEHLPQEHPARPRFERQFREMAGKLISLQQPDGLWRASLLDPDNYPLKETSSSSFYCFAFAWGVNHGLLERSTYGASAEKAWAELVSCVDRDGRLTHVQPIGADPKRFDESATEIYGVGAFLLAGSEIYKLAP